MQNDESSLNAVKRNPGKVGFKVSAKALLSRSPAAKFVDVDHGQSLIARWFSMLKR